MDVRNGGYTLSLDLPSSNVYNTPYTDDNPGLQINSSMWYNTSINI